MATYYFPDINQREWTLSPSYPMSPERSTSTPSSNGSGHVDQVRAIEPTFIAKAHNEGYALTQENGQRRYGPPLNWHGDPPPRGCEVFVGKIPRDLTEQQLVPIFKDIGQIYELRLMMDFSGTNRGFGFVTYTCKEDADKAWRTLDNWEIRPGRHIGVVLSVDNARLFVGGIPRNKTKEEVKEEVKKLTDDVVDVYLYPSATDKSKNRGFAFVEYTSHRAATAARRKLCPGKITLFGNEICVDWAEPEPDVPDYIMGQVRVLYARSFMMGTTEQKIREVFESAGGEGTIEKVKKIRDYAFIHFSTREAAEKALKEMNGYNLDGAELEVLWSKPPDASISKYVKSVVRMGSRAFQNPVSGNIHNNIVAAASQMYAASSNPNIPMANGTNPSMYAGFPFIDQNASGANQAMHSRMNLKGRGAAGMRSAAFQTSINNAMRRTRRKMSEQTMLNDVLSPNLMTTPNGLFLLPAPSFALPFAALRSSGYPTMVQPPGSPLSPNPFTLKGNCQVLSDSCKLYGWSEPEYQEVVLATKDGAGRDIPLYVYKVHIPELANRFGYFQPQSPMANSESAREFAAQFTLLTLGLSTNGAIFPTPESSPVKEDVKPPFVFYNEPPPTSYQQFPPPASPIVHFSISHPPVLQQEMPSPKITIPVAPINGGSGFHQFIYPPMSPRGGFVPWLMPDMSGNLQQTMAFPVMATTRLATST